MIDRITRSTETRTIASISQGLEEIRDPTFEN